MVTSGEPAGIGPDVCVALAASDWDCELVVAGDARLLAAAAAALGITLRLRAYERSSPAQPHRAGELCVLDMACAVPSTPGVLDVRNSHYVIELLDRACDGCLTGEFAAMVTAPVQKSILLDAGFAFSGHTEYLAQRAHAALPVMMLVGGGLRVALVTTHLALAQVPAAITRERLLDTLVIVHDALRDTFKIPQPRMLVLGLNPHAGERGHLGREEIEVIEPVLAQLRTQGVDARGPVPADTAFGPKNLQQVEAVVAMYHDQGLPVLKHASFGEAVNVTLGLPFVRTSVDHGTALDLARSGRADPGSMRAALRLAIDLARS